MTTKALQSLIDKAAALPSELQDQFARQWLEELEDEQVWDEKFARSQGHLEAMAKKALENYQAGKTTPKGWDEI